MTKAFFKENKVTYEEKDVSTDEKSRDEMIVNSNQMGVPVIDVDGELVVGFDKIRLSELIGL